MCENSSTGETSQVDVKELLLDAELVCFEFEGAVCDATGGKFDVARVLAKLAKRFILPIDVLDSRDTFELLARLDSNGTEVAESGDNAATELECKAIEEANLRPGIRSLLTLIRESGRKTACVSRMSERAVRAFLEKNQINDSLDSIVTRPRALSHMMPKPHVLYTTLFNLGIRKPEKTLLIASSEPACEAADKIRIPVVCYEVSHNEGASRTRPRQTVHDFAVLARPLGQVSLDDHERTLQRSIDLSYKGILTHAEMLEYLLITGGGKSLGNLNHYGLVDKETARENLWILEYTRREAAGRKLVLEVFASTAILIEMELRRWFAVRKGRVFGRQEKLTLGRLVKEATEAGLDPELSSRLSSFVNSRNIGIHRVIQGERKYFDLGKDYMRDPSLYEDLAIWVSGELPEIVDLAAGTWISVGQGSTEETTENNP